MKLTCSGTQDGGCTVADRLVDAPIFAGGAGTSDGHIRNTSGDLGPITSNGKISIISLRSRKTDKTALTFHRRSILHSCYLLKSKSTSERKKNIETQAVKRTGSCGREINTNYLG